MKFFAILCHTLPHFGYGWMLQGDADDFTIPAWKKQILDYLKENPTVSPMLLSTAYNIPLKTAQQNLYRLAKEGVIQKVGHGTYQLAD